MQIECFYLYKEKAIEWFTRGAIEGDAEAQNELGIMYRDGDLVEKDYLIAKDYFEKALEAVENDKAAKLMLERCEEFIKNPPENWDGAIAFMTK